MAPEDPVRVLLVEDNEPLRELTREVLESTGRFKVVAEAGDGEQALQLCRQYQCDLVLLDLRMPGRDGFDILPELRAHSPRLPIIVYSMMPREGHEKRALGLGADAFIEKSVDSEELLRRLFSFARLRSGNAGP